MITGYLRAGSANHFPFAVTVSASPDRLWVTAELHACPYGEDASAAASIMNGRGINNAAGPSPAPKNEIDPSADCLARRPSRANLNVKDRSPACFGGEAMTIVSFN